MNRVAAGLVATAALACSAWAQADSAGTPGPAPAPAAEESVAALKGRVDGLEESYLVTKATAEKLAKFKFSGYIQVQYRWALDTVGNKYYKIGDFAGGAMGDNMDGKFQVRRGRLKLTYDNTLTQAVIQLDCTPSGVAIKDAYLVFKEPWLKIFALKGGVFDRPFGYEISYSSSSRESPERSRLFQALFPGERDLGAELDIAAPDNAPRAARIFNGKTGAFTGNGILDESDSHRDVIGRLGFSLPIAAANMGFDGGFSAYRGMVTNTDTTLGIGGRGFDYSIYDSTGLGKVFKKSEAGKMDEGYVRQYFGGDLQYYCDIPHLGGLQLRGEVIGGQQPATKGSSGFYNAGRNSTTPIYMRDFIGWYATWVQNWGTHVQSVLKYDVYDPNTKVKGRNIDSVGIKNGLSATDLKYNTLGVGLIYHWDENLKFVLYLDHVTNEKMAGNAANMAAGAKDKAILPYTKDLKDDVLTLRIQYKF